VRVVFTFAWGWKPTVLFASLASVAAACRKAGSTACGTSASGMGT